MKLKTIIMVIVFLSLININFVNAELYFWNTINIDESSSTIEEYAYYQFQDTSASGIGKNKDISILLYSEIESLPFNFSGIYPVEVDFCNYTINQDINIYDGNGDFINTTTETTTLSFINQPLNVTQLKFRLRSRDSLRISMSCHYTDSDYLYVENILVGRFFTYFPSFECEGCEKYTLEELSHEIESKEQITQNELLIYERIQTLFDWNYQIWLIISWIIKIAFIFLAIFLLFSSIYYFYKLLKDFSDEI